jgi:hypothetical protein
MALCVHDIQHGVAFTMLERYALLSSRFPRCSCPRVSQNTLWSIHLPTRRRQPMSFLQATHASYRARPAPETALIRFASSALGRSTTAKSPLGPTEGAGTETVGKVKRTSSLAICLTSCATALYTVVCSLSLHLHVHSLLSRGILSLYTVLTTLATISSNESNPLYCY